MISKELIHQLRAFFYIVLGANVLVYLLNLLKHLKSEFTNFTLYSIISSVFVLIMIIHYFAAIRKKQWLLQYSTITSLIVTVGMTEMTMLINPEGTFSESNMLLVVCLAVLSQFAYNLQHKLMTYVAISLYELVRTFFTYKDKA